jgi:hypothetical protein
LTVVQLTVLGLRFAHFRPRLGGLVQHHG